MPIPTAHEVIEYLEGYGIETKEIVNSESVVGTESTDILTISGNYRYSDGDMARFTTVGTLPVPLVTNSLYYVIYVSDTEIKIANSYLNAMAGNAIDITVDGTGILIKEDYKFLSQEWIKKRINNMVIPAVERIIDSPLGEIEEVERYYSGTGSSILFTNERNIVELKNIEIVTSNFANANVNISSVIVIPEQGILKARHSNEDLYAFYPIFPRGNRNIKITYTIGYETLPEDLKEAVILFTCDVVLGFVGARTGGGDSFSIQSYNRHYGDRGKYSDVRKEFVRQAMFILQKYMTSIVGS